MKNHFPNIDPAVAEDLISRCAAGQHDRAGGNSKAFIFGNYVVLKTNGINVKNAETPEGEIPFDTVISRLEKLKNDGVRVVPILGYQYDPESTHDYGETSFASGFIIQDRAEGLEMWDRAHLADKDYLVKRTQTFANAPQEHFDKFVADYAAIVRAGINVDPSKKSNFFYDKTKGFSFIDLNSTTNDTAKTEQFLPNYCCLPCHQFLNERQLPVIKNFTEAEFDQLLADNLAIFEKCKSAIIANGLATEQQISASLAAAKDGKFPECGKLPPMLVAGLTNSFTLRDCLSRPEPPTRHSEW
jgi:hypothetical protein